LIENGEKKYWGERIDGFRKWDTKPDVRKKQSSSTRNSDSKVKTSRIPGWAKNNIVGAHIYFIFTGIDPGSGIKY
jgi:hypothetical protein